MDILRKRSRRQVWLRRLAVLLIAVVAGAGIVALTRLDRPAQEVDRRAVWLGEVERGSMLIEVRAPGRLVPEGARWIAAPADGTIDRVLAQPGDRLAPGQVVLELVNPEIERAALEAELDSRSERAQVAAATNRLHNELLDLEVELARLEADLGEARLRLQADLALAEDGLVAPLDIAVRRLRVAQLDRQVGLEHSRLERKRDALPAEMDSLGARLDQAEALLGFRRRESAALFVRVRDAGVIAEIDADAGTRVGRGDPIARVIEPGRLKAELDVPQVRAREVRLGQRCLVDTRNGTFVGRVTRIDPSVQEGIVRVDVVAEEPLPDGARAELRVDGRIEIERLQDVVHMQRPADVRAHTTLQLFRLAENSDLAERVEVELGRTSVRTVEVRAGLQPGQRVILSDTSSWSRADRLRLR